MATSEKFWSMGRADYVGLKLVLLCAPVVYALWALLPGVLGWIGGEALEWASTVNRPAPAEVPTLGGATVAYDGGVVWTIPDPTTAQRVLALVPAAEVTMLLALGCWALWRLLTRLRSGDAFGIGALDSVRGLAVLVLAYALFVPGTRVLLDFFVTAASQPDPAAYFTLTPGGLLPFVLGLLLLALAECFRQGVRLREDVEGLV